MSSSAAYKVQKVPSPQSILGEGPHWDGKTQSVYYVDMFRANECSIHRYDAAENKTYGASVEDETHVSFIIPVAGAIDLFAVGLRRRVAVIQWDGKSTVAKVLRIAFEVEQDNTLQNSALNDGKADPIGRLYTGTISSGVSNEIKEFDDIFKNSNYTNVLYRYDTKTKVIEVRNKIGLSNGLAWNEKKNKFYYVDSCDSNINEFNYDPKTGDICK